MKFPPNIDGLKVLKILVKHYDYTICGRRGSHVSLKKDNVDDILTIVIRKNSKKGTILAILRKANIDRDDFLSYL